MARAPDARTEQAEKLFREGRKLIEISELLGIPEGTIRSWKKRYNWDNATLQKKKRNVAKENSEKQDKEKAVAREIEQILENSALTDKQQLFCCFYIKSFNATKAYQKAYGVDYATALAAGPRMLGNVRIKSEIQKLKQGRINREMLEEEDIFQKYMDIAFADITDYVEFGQEEQPVMAAFGPVKVKNEDSGKNEILKKRVNVVRFKESSEVDGTIISKVKQGKDGASIELADRMKALQWLSEHMSFATEEQKARIAQMRAQTEKLTGEKEADIALYKLDEILKGVKENAESEPKTE